MDNCKKEQNIIDTLSNMKISETKPRTFWKVAVDNDDHLVFIALALLIALMVWAMCESVIHMSEQKLSTHLETLFMVGLFAEIVVVSGSVIGIFYVKNLIDEEIG